MHDAHDAYKSPQPLNLFPEKLFYKIGEVSRIVGVESYVLRYWETEFPFLKPRKSKAGQRVYTKVEIDLVRQIKHLLYEEKYTIDGVRRRLSGAAEHQDAQPELQRHEAQEAKTPSDPGPERTEPKINAEEVLNMVKLRLKELLHHHFGA